MIAENLSRLEQKIAEKCLKSGRKRSEITLIAVSKTQPVDILEEAFNTGVIDFGENKAQELRDKAELIQKKINWHFIGHLQSNKIKYVIKASEFIHSVDSLKLAEEINRKALQNNKIQNVLLEIKTSDEESKYGLDNESDIFKIAEFCGISKNISLVGLMTMAPYTDNEKIIRSCFKKMYDLKTKMNDRGFSISHLSMGMTNDYEIAIEEGATMLRIGTAIFSERN